MDNHCENIMFVIVINFSTNFRNKTMINSTESNLGTTIISYKKLYSN